MSGYLSPDTFGSMPGNVRVADPATGIVYTLAFGPGSPPAVLYQAVSTWARAKSLLGPSWADAKRRAATWGVAKSIVGT
jgi:hypothetical protein